MTRIVAREKNRAELAEEKSEVLRFPACLCRTRSGQHSARNAQPTRYQRSPPPHAAPLGASNAHAIPTPSLTWRFRPLALLGQ